MSPPLLISRILDPMWVMAAVTILGAYQMGVQNGILLILLMLLPPILLRSWFARQKNASGWDIRDRAHRPKIIFVLLLLGILNTALAWTLGNATLGKLFIFYELWLAGFFIISLFWKISGHAGAVALAAGLVIRWFGWSWWPVLVLIPIMGYARVATNDHTVGQVTGGAAYSMSLMSLMGLML